MRNSENFTSSEVKKLVQEIYQSRESSRYRILAKFLVRNGFDRLYIRNRVMFYHPISTLVITKNRTHNKYDVDFQTKSELQKWVPYTKLYSLNIVIEKIDEVLCGLEYQEDVHNAARSNNLHY